MTLLEGKEAEKFLGYGEEFDKEIRKTFGYNPNRETLQ